MDKTSPKPPLSIVIITLNEEKNIGRFFQSLRFKIPFEVILVDAQSTDQTASLARKRGAKVFIRAWKGFSDQKNWALAKARGDWILSLDADEELTQPLIREIEKKISEKSTIAEGFALKRRAFFLGRWIKHCGWWPDSQLRLIRRGAGRFSDKPVHEGIEIKGPVLELVEPMNHFTYDSIGQYLEKMNRYSSLAILQVKPKKKIFWRFYLTAAPVLTFFRMYVSRRGFLDGWHGFVLCALSAYHDFCKYAKLWEKEILGRGPR